VEFFVRLWRGDAPESRTLFRWTRAVAEATGVPAEAVGPVATLLWLSYALGDLEHAERVERVENKPRAFQPFTVRAANRWLEDPALGPGWSRWRAG
jgi:hypothetical protein